MDSETDHEFDPAFDDLDVGATDTEPFTPSGGKFVDKTPVVEPANLVPEDDVHDRIFQSVKEKAAPTIAPPALPVIAKPRKGFFSVFTGMFARRPTAKNIEPAVVAPADDLSEHIFKPIEEKQSASVELTDEEMAAAAAAAATGSHGIFRADGTRVASATVAAPPTSAFMERKQRVSFFSTLKGMFARKPQPPVAEKKPEGPKEKVVLTDLDTLFSGQKTDAAPVTQTKKEMQPALPTAELMREDAAPADGLARRANASAPAQSDGKPAAPEVTLPPLDIMKKDVKKEPEKPKPEPKKEVSKPAPDIVYKPRAAHHNSGFGELLGSIKYIGLGKERFSFIQNLATMLNAGLPLIDSLKTLQAETRVRPMKKLIGQIVELVENGSALWRAMEAMHFFSPHAIALVRIGEEAGNLAENMEYLAAQQEKDQALKAKVTMAMIYPTIVLTIMFIIIIGLGMFVLPSLISVLFSLNVELPFTTRMVIAFTNFFTTYGYIAVPGMVGGFIVAGILLKFTPLKVFGQWMLFQIPGIGRLVREATIARFGVILGGLLQAGVPLTDALHSLAEVTPIVSYKKLYEKILARIVLGDSFSKCFASIRNSPKLLPISVQQLVTTGEKSGSLSAILLKVADIYEKKANNTAEKLPVILEPMLLLFIGGLVGTIAFSIIVPIYSIVGNVGH